MFESFDEFRHKEQVNEAKAQEIIDDIEKRVGKLENKTKEWVLKFINSVEFTPSQTQMFNRMINMIIQQIA